jgi:hypothetical protein
MYVPPCQELMMLEKIVVAIVVELSILLVRAVFGVTPGCVLAPEKGRQESTSGR